MADERTFHPDARCGACGGPPDWRAIAARLAEIVQQSECLYWTSPKMKARAQDALRDYEAAKGSSDAR